MNPDHVASLRPRKTIVPVDAQQDPRGDIAYSGTIVSLVTGTQHFVTEDFDAVHTQVLAGRTPAPVISEDLGPTPETEITEDVPAAEDAPTPQTVPESTTPSTDSGTPPKKVPAKKAPAKAVAPEPEPSAAE